MIVISIREMIAIALNIMAKRTDFVDRRAHIDGLYAKVAIQSIRDFDCFFFHLVVNIINIVLPSLISSFSHGTHYCNDLLDADIYW